MHCTHLTWSAQGRATLFVTERARRAAVRAIARVLGPWLVVFCVVDDHVHVVVLCPEPMVRTLARDLTFALRALTRVELDPVYVRPLRTRAHAEYVIRTYVLLQPRKHGLSTHPALWSGSCFADLVGGRVLPGPPLRIRDALPRFDVGRARDAVGLRGPLPGPAGDAQVRAAGAARLVSAAAFSCAAAPTLDDRSAEACLARRTAAQLSRESGIASVELAAALGITHQSACRLRRQPPSPTHARATRTWLALEDHVRAS